jgi:hypothetical protein
LRLECEEAVVSRSITEQVALSEVYSPILGVRQAMLKLTLEVAEAKGIDTAPVDCR